MFHGTLGNNRVMDHAGHYRSQVLRHLRRLRKATVGEFLRNGNPLAGTNGGAPVFVPSIRPSTRCVWKPRHSTRPWAIRWECYQWDHQSGSNTLHGSAFWQMQQTRWNATPDFSRLRTSRVGHMANGGGGNTRQKIRKFSQPGSAICQNADREACCPDLVVALIYYSHRMAQGRSNGEVSTRISLTASKRPRKPARPPLVPVSGLPSSQEFARCRWPDRRCRSWRCRRDPSPGCCPSVPVKNIPGATRLQRKRVHGVIRQLRDVAAINTRPPAALVVSSNARVRRDFDRLGSLANLELEIQRQPVPGIQYNSAAHQFLEPLHLYETM